MNKFFGKLIYGKQWGYEVLFKNQEKSATGKTGVILGEMGMPEEYDPDFYVNYMKHVFHYSVPGFVAGKILQDKGVGLVDPENAIAREPFKPKQLIDAFGSFKNKAGVDYVDCPVTWKPANLKNQWDYGYFLYTGDGPNGMPDICEKVGARTIGWYYGKLLPEKRFPLRRQMRLVYEDAVGILKQRYPAVEFRQAYYMDDENFSSAVEDLLADGCQTILYQETSYPVFSDFEDYCHTLPRLHELVNQRARLIFCDQPGKQPDLREAYLQLLQDQLLEIPGEKSVLVILCVHGHPFKKETMEKRASLYRQPLEEGVRSLLAGRPGKWDVLWASDEFADSYWDKKNEKLETCAAFRKAIEEGWDYALELPTEFLAENSDTMITHAMRKYYVFPTYDVNIPVAYMDWEAPLVRRFSAGKTTGIYCGTPVGPYRKYIVQAVVDSISEVLGGAGGSPLFF